MIRILERVALAGLVAALGLQAAWAQAPLPVRVAGVVERVDGPTLVVRTAQGEQTLRLASDASIVVLEKGSLAEVKPGSFIGVGAAPREDGTLRAQQVTIFAESMRGLGEGHRPWTQPGTTMTNATVEATVASVDGQVVNVRYRDGEKKIVIGPEATIRSFVAGNRSDLKPGVAVTINAVAAKAGAPVEASRISIDRSAPARN